MNQICAEQNSDQQLERLAAQREIYTLAKRVFTAHALLSTVVAGGLSAVALFAPEMKPYAALWGGVLMFLDVLWLTPWQQRLRGIAARIQESFDCQVLGLPWQSIKVGRAVDHETIAEYATRYRETEPSFESLRNWYPPTVCALPLFLARVICQRVNPWWEAKQRRLYAFVLVATVVALLIMLVLIGVVRRMPVGDLLLTTVVPLLSGITFALRQYKENSGAAERLESLRNESDSLWKRALAGATEEELAPSCRELQDELFEHRKRNVPVFDWLYKRLRSAQEFQMQQNAVQLVREFKAARPDAAQAELTALDSAKGGKA
jgi:hypothetical protein